MFRTVVVLAKVLAVGGAAASALVHFTTFTGVALVFSGRILALAVLAAFPLGGFAILLLLRVGRTYRVWGNHQLTFVRQRTPKPLRVLTDIVFVYALICFAVSYVVRSSTIVGSLAASAFVAWFHLVFTGVFSVSLGDPRIVRPRPRSGEHCAPPSLN